MKIENLEIHDFKCFHDLKLAFDKPVNIIFGQNAVGKSTIAQAIELALTGKLNSLGSAKIKNSLARSGAEEYSVTAVVSDQGKRLKLLQSSKERGPEMEIDKAVLACLLDSTRFLKEHPDNRKQLLFDLLGLTIEEGNLKKHLGNWLQAHPEVLAKSWRSGGDFQELISCLEEFPKSLNQGYEEACEERKLVKREFKTFEALNAKALPQGLSVKTLAEQIRQKEEELAGLHTKIGEIRGVALGEEKSLESEISALSGKILQLEAEIKAFNPEGEKAELTRLIEEKNNLDNDLNELEEELQGLDRDIITLEAIYRENEALSVRIQNFTGLCPLFREDQFICQTSEVLEAVRERKIAIRNNEKMQTLKENKKRVLEMIDRKQKRHISIEGGIISHKASLSRFEKNEKDLEVLRVKREKQVQVVKSLDGRNKVEIAAAKERVKAL